MAAFSGWIFVIKEAGLRLGGGSLSESTAPPSGAIPGSMSASSVVASSAVPRFMVLLQRNLFMYKKDPQFASNEEPTFKGVIQSDSVVEILGRRVLPNGQVLHVFSIATDLAQSRKAEIGCSTAETAHQWVKALEGAAAGVEQEGVLDGDSARHSSLVGGPVAMKKADDEEDDAMDSTKWRLIKLINGLRIFEGDLSPDEASRSRVFKAEGVVDAEPDRIFEVVMSFEPSTKREWDLITTDAQVVEVIDGFTDIVHAAFAVPGKGNKGTKRELLLRRTWRRSPDGSYVISMFPEQGHSQVTFSEKSLRLDNTIISWDIVPLAPTSLGPSAAGTHRPWARSLVRLVLEVQRAAGGPPSRGQPRFSFLRGASDKSSSAGEESKERRLTFNLRGAISRDDAAAAAVFEPGFVLEEYHEGIPFLSMLRIAGLREYFAALPPPPDAASTRGPSGDGRTLSEVWGVPASGFIVPTSTMLDSVSSMVGAGAVVVGGDEFFDALEISAKEDQDNLMHDRAQKRWQKLKWAMKFGILIQSFADEEAGIAWSVKRELLHNVAPVNLALLGPQLASLGNVQRDESTETGQNAWRDPGGANFCVRGPTYLLDKVKIPAGEPLLKIVGMDWFTDDQRIDNVANRPGCLIQSEAAKSIPFFFVINLQVPGTPHYSLVVYFAADRPVRTQPQSLLYRFFTRDDAYRNSRLKLIPRIAEGHWMVKRAVGTKACILGKALKCSYLKGPNYIEMDCDIGSSSVARNVIGLVISYVTTLVVDLTFLIEAQEAEDLPEYLLGAFTCTRMDTKKAVKPPPPGPSKDESEGAQAPTPSTGA